MQPTKPQFYFLLSLLIISGVVSFFIFRPFLFAFILAIVCAVVMQPMFRRLVRYTKGKRGISALLTIALVVIFIFIPFILLSILIVRDAREVYISIITSSTPINTYIIDLLDNFMGQDIISGLSVNIDQYISQGLSWIVRSMGTFFTSLAALLTNGIVFIISFYYILKEGKNIRTTLISLSPLSESHDEAILNNLQKSVNSVIRGNILIALIQGVLAMIGFTIFGVPNPVLWGSVAAVTALVPMVGTSLVLIPSVLYLFLTGNNIPAVGLLVWGMVVVGLIDNLLAPKIVGKYMQMHPLVILLAVLGGIAFLGPVGFIIGPLTVSLFWTLSNVFISITRNKAIS